MGFRVRVLVVDDEPIIRGLIAEVLSSHDYDVSVAGNATEARQVAAEFDPDVALVDIDLGAGPSGIDLEMSLRNAHPGLATVFITNLPSPRLLGGKRPVIPESAAYLVKSRIADSKVLLVAISLACRGLGSQRRDDKAPSSSTSKLTTSQVDVMRMVSLGYSNAEIAEKRGTSERAVRMLVSRAFSSIGVTGTRGANRVRAAIRFLDETGQRWP
jgi:DNA-binding NarL/FixJ family response regulator